MESRRLPTHLRVPLIYALAGSGWILFSDALLALLVSDHALSAGLQVAKGWAFVLLSALLIGLLLRQSARAERLADERYRQLFTHSMDAILLSAPDGSVVAANPAACALFQRSAAEIYRGGRAALVDPGDERLGPALAERASSGGFRGELRFRRGDGTTFTGEFTSALFADSAGAPRTSMIIRDVSARLRAEDAVRAARDRLANVLDTITDAFITLDRDWRITYVNPEAARLNQKPAAAFLGKTHWEEWPASLGTVVEREYRRAMAERTAVHFEHRYLVPGEYDLWLDIHAYPSDEGLSIYYHDISARKRAEAELRASHAELQALTRRLTEVEGRERRQLARELHDRVGQMLTALGINLSIVQSQLSPDSTRQIGPRIADSLQLVAETVECVRDVMANLYPPVLADYGLAAALRWYAERFTARTGVAVQVVAPTAADSQLPEPTAATLFRVAQEALNNVARHAAASAVTVSLEHGPPVRLTIADDGRGFDPGRPARPASGGGWGLGSMAERVAALGGRMQLRSAPGAGTAITFEIPPGPAEGAAL